MKTIAERIREGLEIREMKQSELVSATGIGKSSISTYLSGDYEPKQRNIYKIAQALHVSEAWLMGYDVPMTPQTEAAPVMPSLSSDVLELAQQIQQLDNEDRAVIRGEVRAMLRADKYLTEKKDQVS